MTAKEMREAYLGREGMLVVPGNPGALHLPVRVKDARVVWGRLDLLVAPVGGSGESWIEANRVNLEGE